MNGILLFACGYVLGNLIGKDKTVAGFQWVWQKLLGLFKKD